jgi:hypothetical protein
LQALLSLPPFANVFREKHHSSTCRS